MNEKYLEAWNFIKDQMPNFTFSHLIEEMGENSDIVDNALQRLNVIDSAESNETLKYIEKEIKDLEIKLEKDIKLRDKLTIYQHNALENCVGRISKYESKLSQLNAIKQNLIKAQELEKENVKLKQSEKLLMAKKYGFFNSYERWKTDEFVIDYDTVRNEFCLRSIAMGYTLGKTRFYESDYKKTWWLRKR